MALVYRGSMNNSEFWNLIDFLVAQHEIVIDRPKNSVHPRYPDYIYPMDYGYLIGTKNIDGEAVDIWVGSLRQNKTTAIISSVDVIKGDLEVKILYDCTEEEIDQIYSFHNKNKNMKGVLNKRYYDK